MNKCLCISTIFITFLNSRVILYMEISQFSMPHISRPPQATNASTSYSTSFIRRIIPRDKGKKQHIKSIRLALYIREQRMTATEWLFKSFISASWIFSPSHLYLTVLRFVHTVAICRWTLQPDVLRIKKEKEWREGIIGSVEAVGRKRGSRVIYFALIFLLAGNSHWNCELPERA